MAVVLCGGGVAEAQQSNHIDDSAHLGLGAAFNLLSLNVVGGVITTAGPFGGGSILIPIDILGAVRLEPEIGFFHSTDKEEDAAGNETIDTVTAVRPAIGVFWIFALGDSAQGALGARLGPAFVSTGTSGEDPATGADFETDTSRWDFAIGPAFGGEYFFNKHFSLGAEMQINFNIVGNESTSTDPGADPPDTSDSGFIVGTNTMLTARVFFF
jgi:hypothetical protein